MSGSRDYVSISVPCSSIPTALIPSHPHTGRGAWQRAHSS